MGNWFSKLGKKIETAVNNAYPVGTTYYGGMSGAGNMNLSKIEHTANQMDPDEAKEFKKEANTALGVGTAAAVTLPFVANGIQAFRAAHPIISGAIDAGLTVDGVRNALSDNGVKKTWNYIKDGNWGRAVASGTTDALDLLGGVGLIGDTIKGAKYTNLLAKSGRLRGLWDQTKYGIYDRWQGYNIYKNMPDATGIHSYKPYDSAHNKAIEDIYTIGGKQRQGLPLTPSEFDLAKDMPFTSGRHMDDFNHLLSTNWKDADLWNTSFTFMGNYDYLRNGSGVISQRGWRMGFTPQHGTALPKAFTAANKQAIANAPSGSFISADAMGLTIPESMEVLLGWGKRPMKALLDGSWTNANPSLNYGMSADAYRFFTMQGLLPGNRVVYAGQHGLFNNEAVRNADVYNWLEAYRSGQMTAKQYVDKFNNWAKEFGGRPGHVDFKTGEPYFYHPVIYKQKSGGSIKIKKKNRGKFTDYCGGKVTEECIRKGKNSSNPTTRKRANFAWVARHKFKHEEGGKINYLNIF